MSYITCLNCGQKALSVATRCPHCGAPFGTRNTYNAPPPRSRIPLLLLLLAGLGAVIVGGDFFRRERTAPAPEPAAPPVAAADSLRQAAPAPPPPSLTTPAAPSESLRASVDTGIKSTPAAVPVKQPEPAAPPVDTTPHLAPPPPPPPRPPAPPQPPPPAAAAEPAAVAGDTSAPSAGGSPERRYANLWVNVRSARRPQADVVKVLRPGEPVMVDSLKEGWYRVVVDGQAVGYVYREFLDSVAP